tara:strand:- start:1505 stop:1642 length:138 start_codon:yes stop_codon:yes gene_type:complete
MTKLAELKAAYDAAWATYYAYYDAYDDAREAYRIELKKQKEKTND